MPATDQSVQFGSVVQALCAGFSQTLNLSLTLDEPTPAEIRCAAELIRVQFANPEWTGRR